VNTLAAIGEGLVAGGVAVALGAPLWVGWVVGYAIYTAMVCAEAIQVGAAWRR